MRGASERAFVAGVVAAALLARGCFSTGVVAQSACHGRVVVAGSGEPLAGAEVFEVRSLSRWIHLDSVDVTARWGGTVLESAERWRGRLPVAAPATISTYA